MLIPVIREREEDVGKTGGGSMTMKPIETLYNGYRFRSRLEARWAVFFDSLGIEYEYEPEGVDIGGVRYLPDFYLPESRSFFEVKGVMSEYDELKINALISAGYAVTIGYADGKFIACNNHGNTKFELCTDGDSVLMRCGICGKCWFMGIHGWWDCQCCGKESIKFSSSLMLCSDGKKIKSGRELWDVARQARFEDFCKKAEEDDADEIIRAVITPNHINLMNDTEEEAC